MNATIARGGLKRYTKQGDKEKKQNQYIREMIEVLKNMKLKSNLYVKAIKLSDHAYKRTRQHFGTHLNLASATKEVREMLKSAVRVGTILSYDGQVNVLYVYQKTAIFVSPDLKTVITVNRYDKKDFYHPIFKQITADTTEDEIAQMHRKLLLQMELEEEYLTKRVLSIEQKVRDASDQCRYLLQSTKSRSRRDDLKALISDQGYQLKVEGRKLFNLMVEKRRLCRSMVRYL